MTLFCLGGLFVVRTSTFNVEPPTPPSEIPVIGGEAGDIIGGEGGEMIGQE